MQIFKNLEFLQKKALGIILGTVYIENKRFYKSGKDHITYFEALEKLGLITLDQRREILTCNFALETAKNDRHSDIFPKISKDRRTGRSNCIIEEDQCKTERFSKSSVPYMKRLLNGVNFKVDSTK